MPRRILDTLAGAALEQAPAASDFLFTAGALPGALIDGAFTPLTLPGQSAPLTPHQTGLLARGLLGDAWGLVTDLRRRGSCDVSYRHVSGTRFRANIHRAGGSIGIILRRLPTTPASLESLGLPPVLSRLTALADGLVLVVGATGSGKSTTLAALATAILAARPVHVVTLEDPIECLLPPGRGLVSQRELGTDFPSFAEGLRASLRQAPHVIVLGEARDRDTVDAALAAAETGHLVLATLHTADCAGAIERLLAFFGAAEEKLARNRLAGCLRYVVAQRLLPRLGGGRVASVEVLYANLRLRERLASGQDAGLGFADIIEQGGPHGMVGFDAATAALYAAGLVSLEAALAKASDRAALARALDAVKVGRGLPVSDITGLSLERPA
ncbi:twitching motility protein [Desulfovibrio aerotolerans]|uniref:Twitching motility protein n=1 Tax=Solidesulfovibrio aerotolerans TaxID=295255 RepID=A0A7C9IMF9_9BACT|nr:ATPase, T2SS/T4P/T4SS family [Solidesulfovibrio aerotolerans]MYL82419.1 twitching motility protein [Solidesulfovibrio aerotolerans]